MVVKEIEFSSIIFPTHVCTCVCAHKLKSGMYIQLTTYMRVYVYVCMRMCRFICVHKCLCISMEIYAEHVFCLYEDKYISMNVCICK